MRKKSFALWIAIVLGIMIFMLGACSKGGKLGTPNIDFQGSLLKWETVTNATSYVVDVDGTEYPIVENYFDMTLFTKAATYTVKVKALSSDEKWTTSDYSVTKSYIVGTGGTIKLTAPAELKVKNNRLEFSAVAGANKYSVYYGSIFYKDTVEPAIDLVFPEDGEYALMVRAIGAPKFKDSDFSISLLVSVADGLVVKSKFVTPDGLYIQDKILKWRSIEGVGAYVVSINGVDQSPVADANYNLMEINNPQNVVLRVKSLGNSEYSDSSYSEAVYYPYVLRSLQNIQIFGDVILWAENADAENYEVIINGESKIVDEPRYVVAKDTDGIKNVKIRAVGDGVFYLNSLFTEEYIFDVENGKIAQYMLEKPTNIKIENNVLMWDAVPNALSYSIVVDGIMENTPTNTFVMPQTTAVHVIKLRATGNGDNILDSLFSSEYVINQQLDPRTYLNPPTKFRVETELLKWTMSDRQYYTVLSVTDINTGIETIYNGDRDYFNPSILSNGKYKIKVKFKSGDNNIIELYSAELLYEKPAKATNALQTPTGLTVEQGILSWQSVPSATTYDVYVDGKVCAVTEKTSLDISSLATGAMMAFAVKAKNSLSQSNLSSELGYQPDLGYNGDASNPIVISTEEDFLDINLRNDAFYVLNNDIKLTGKFETLFTEKYPFKGSLDGKGYYVENIDVIGDYGMFGVIDQYATITNINFRNVSYNGIKVKDFGVLASRNYGLIKNVGIDFSLTSDTPTVADSNIGGLVGENHGVIRDVSLSGDMAVGKNETVAVGSGNIGFVCGANYGYIECIANGNLIVSGTNAELSVGGITAKNHGSIKNNSATSAINISVNTNTSNVSIGGVAAKTQNDSLLDIVSIGAIVIDLKGDGNVYCVGGIVNENYGKIYGTANSFDNVKKISISAVGKSIVNIAGVCLVNRGEVQALSVAEIKVSGILNPVAPINTLAEQYCPQYLFDIMLVGMIGINYGNVQSINAKKITIDSANTSVITAVAGVNTKNVGKITNCSVDDLSIIGGQSDGGLLNCSAIANVNVGKISGISLSSVTISCERVNVQKKIALLVNDNYGIIKDVVIKYSSIGVSSSYAYRYENKTIVALSINNNGEAEIGGVDVYNATINVLTAENEGEVILCALSYENGGLVNDCTTAFSVFGINYNTAVSVSAYGISKHNKGNISSCNTSLAIGEFVGYIDAYGIVGDNSGRVEAIGLMLDVELTKSNGGAVYIAAKSNTGIIENVFVGGKLNLGTNNIYHDASNQGITGLNIFALENNINIESKSGIDEYIALAVANNTDAWSAYPFAANRERLISRLDIKDVVDVDASGLTNANVYEIGVFGQEYKQGSLPIYFGASGNLFTVDIYGNINITANGTTGRLKVYFPNESGNIIYKEVALKVFGYDGVLGNGTELDPYVIKTESQFNSIVKRPNSYYKLGGDITLTNVVGFNSTFYGQLNGDGHKLIISSISSGMTSLFSKVEGGRIHNLEIVYKNGIVVGDTNAFAGIVRDLINSRIENVGIFFEGIEMGFDGKSNLFSGIVGNVSADSVVTNCFVSANAVANLKPFGSNGVTYNGDFNGLVGENYGSIIGSYFSGKVQVKDENDANVILKLSQICGNNKGIISDVFASARVFAVAEKTKTYIAKENSGTISNVLLYGTLETDGIDKIKMCDVNTGNINNYYYHESSQNIDLSDVTNYSSFNKDSNLSTFSTDKWSKDSASGIYKLVGVMGQDKTYSPVGDVSVDLLAYDYLNSSLAQQAPYDVVFLNFSFEILDNDVIKLERDGFFTAKKIGSTSVRGTCGLMSFNINVILQATIVGEGTIANPYMISTQKEIESMHRLQGAQTYFKLNNDITYTYTSKPIGNLKKPFNGKIDGNGKTLFGVDISSVDGLCGLFGALGANSEIRNFQIDSINLRVNNEGITTSVGGFAATALGGATIINSVIKTMQTFCSTDASVSPFVGVISDDGRITVSTSKVQLLRYKSGSSYVVERFAICKGNAIITDSYAVNESVGSEYVELVSKKFNIEYYLKKHVTDFPSDLGKDLVYSIEAVNSNGWNIAEDGTILTAGKGIGVLDIKIIVSGLGRETRYMLQMEINNAQEKFPFASGSGNMKDPLIVDSVGQLKNLTAEKYRSMSVALGANIDMSSVAVGDIGELYFAFFDGKGHSLDNMNIQFVGEARDCALIGTLKGGEFKNVVFNSPKLTVNFTSASTSPSVINLALLACINESSIDNLIINNAIVNISSVVPYLFGGVCAKNGDKGKISNSSIMLNYSASGNTQAEKVGMIVGEDNGTIEYCQVQSGSTVNIDKSTDVTLGGIVAISLGGNYLGNVVRGLYTIGGEKTVFGGIVAIDGRDETQDKLLTIKKCTIDIALNANSKLLTVGGLIGTTTYKSVANSGDEYSGCVIAVQETITRGDNIIIGAIFGELTVSESSIAIQGCVNLSVVKYFGLTDVADVSLEDKICGKLNGKLMIAEYEPNKDEVYAMIENVPTYAELVDKLNYADADVENTPWYGFVFDGVTAPSYKNTVDSNN